MAAKRLEFTEDETDLEQYINDLSESTDLDDISISASEDKKDAYEYKPEVNTDSNLKKFEAGKMIEVEGATFDLEKINGVYELQEEKFDGRVLYVQSKQHTHIRYHHETKQWFIDTHPLSKSNTADAIVAQDVHHPEQITAVWYVSNHDCTGWVEDRSIKILSMSEGYQKLYRKCLYSPPKQPQPLPQVKERTPPPVVAPPPPVFTEETTISEDSTSHKPEEKKEKPIELTFFQKARPFILYSILAIILIFGGFYFGKKYPNDETIIASEIHQQAVKDHKAVSDSRKKLNTDVETRKKQEVTTEQARKDEIKKFRKAVCAEWQGDTNHCSALFCVVKTSTDKSDKTEGEKEEEEKLECQVDECTEYWIKEDCEKMQCAWTDSPQDGFAKCLTKALVNCVELEKEECEKNTEKCVWGKVAEGEEEMCSEIVLEEEDTCSKHENNREDCEKNGCEFIQAEGDDPSKGTCSKDEGEKDGVPPNGDVKDQNNEEGGGGKDEDDVTVDGEEGEDGY